MIIQKSSKYQFDKPMIERIKGHTKIELTDVKTKHRKVIESDNTFQTDVLADKMLGGIFRQGPYDDVIPTGNHTLADIALAQMQRTVGGIMLFDSEITVPSKYMPAGVKMVANGGYGVTNAANPPELGSYNSIESQISNNSYQFVYDWGTSQGNGTIASICLTSRTGGVVGMGNPSGTTLSELWNITSGQIHTSRVPQEKMIHYGDYCYVFDTAVTSANKTIMVKKYTLNGITKASIFDCRYKTLTYTWSESISGLESTFSLFPITDGKGKIIFPLPYSKGGYADYIANNETGYYVELDCTTDTFTMKSLTNHTGKALHWGSYSWSSYDSDNGYLLVAEKDTSTSYIWYDLLLVDLSDGTLVKNLLEESRTWIARGGFKFAENLWYFGENTSVAYIYDAVNDTSYPINSLTNTYGNESFLGFDRTVSYVDDASGLIFSNYNDNNNIYYNPCFLSTINNLDNEVTKNSTQTMKVTYTLTEV